MTIFVILVIGFLLRIISLNQSLWLDEATTALVSKMDIADIFGKFLPGDFHPPLYYLLMKYWVACFGASEVSLRMPSVLFGIGTIYVTYLIAKKLYGKKTGVVSALLLATGGLSIYYSQEARMYSMAAFLVSLAIYMFITNKWFLLSIAIMLIGMTDYVSLFILPVFWYFGIKRRGLILSHIPLVLFFAIWQPVFLKQLAAGVSVKINIPGWWNILGGLTFKNIALIPIKFTLGRINFENPVIYGILGVFTVGLFAYLLSKVFKKSKILWFWLLTPVAIGAVVSLEIPTLTYFRFLFCLPALYILAAGGLSRINKFGSKVLLAVLILVNLSSSVYYLANPRFHREDWRSLVKYTEARKTNNSLTIFLADSNMEAYRYYAPDAKIAGPLGVKPGLDQVWVMNYLAEVFDADGKTEAKVKSLGYTYAGRYDYNGVAITEYIK